MSYFKDLTPYRYFHMPGHGALNVGWIDAERPLPTGDVPANFIHRLEVLSRVRVNQTRGLFACGFCPGRQSGVKKYKAHDGIMHLGSAEIRVIAPDRTLYACPDLLLHYIREHHYLPPQAFVEAVLTGPLPPDPAYFKVIEAIDPDYEPHEDWE